MTTDPRLLSAEDLSYIRNEVAASRTTTSGELEIERCRHLLCHIDALETERAQSRAAIAKVFAAVERGDIDLVHEDGCPEDDTCECPITRVMLELRLSGGDSKAAALLAEFDRAANPLFEIGGTKEPWQP
ncbi:MAG TPA: hypothetical protein VFQ42_22160 [Mycobacterium sp.]|nr:hypothetical protein [Mycobacterium sp.]